MKEKTKKLKKEFNKMEKTLYITFTYVGFLALYGSFIYDLFKIKNR